MEKENFKVYQLRVAFDRDNNIFRVIKIRDDNSLEDLANRILKSINFDDDHLYLFNMDNNYYNGTNTYQRAYHDLKKSEKVLLREIGLEEKQVFQLWYDFGEDWFFSIIVEKIEDSSRFKKARVVSSQGKLKQYLSEAELDAYLNGYFDKDSKKDSDEDEDDGYYQSSLKEFE